MTKQFKTTNLHTFQPPKKRKLRAPLSVDVIPISLVGPLILGAAFIAARFLGVPTVYALLGLYAILLLWYYSVFKRLFQTSYTEQPADMIMSGLCLIWVPFVTGVFKPFASLLPSVVTANFPLRSSYSLLRSTIQWHHTVEAAAAWMFFLIPILLGLARLLRGVYYIFSHLSDHQLPDAYLEPHKPDWYDLKRMVDDLKEKNAALSQQANDLTSERDNLGFELSQAKSEVANLTKHATELSIERRGLLDELSTLKQHQRQLAENFNSSQETVLVLRKAYEEMAAKVRATARTDTAPHHPPTSTVIDDALGASGQSVPFFPRPKQNLRERQNQLNALTSNGAALSTPSAADEAEPNKPEPSANEDTRDTDDELPNVDSTLAAISSETEDQSAATDGPGKNTREDDQTAPKATPTSIALSALESDLVVQSTTIPSIEPEAIDDSAGNNTDVEISKEQGERTPDFEDALETNESTSSVSALAAADDPDHVRPITPLPVRTEAAAHERVSPELDEKFRKSVNEYFRAKRAKRKQIEDLKNTKGLSKAEILIRQYMLEDNIKFPKPNKSPAPIPSAEVSKPEPKKQHAEGPFTNLTQWGVEDPDKLIVIVPTGETHALQGLKHLHNFVGYLFSLSKNHRPNEDTSKNTIIQWRRGEIQDILMNEDPYFYKKNFSENFYTLFDRFAELLDDVVYVGFIVDVDGTLYSNMVTGEVNNGDYHVSVFEPEVFDMAAEQMGGGDNLKRAIELITGETRPIFNWETADRIKVCRPIDVTCQKLFHTLDPSTVHITVSHRDQKDHNQIYHIHRLRDKKPGETATLSQEEIDRQKLQWQTTATTISDKTEGLSAQSIPTDDFETLKKQTLEDIARQKAANETPPSA